MVLLSKGFKLPETGDLGSVWFPAMEDNINQMNTHDHDGSDSEKIKAINLINTGSTLTVAGGSFVDQGDGYWRATVTVPSLGTVDNFVVTAKDPTTKDPIFLKMEKLSSTQFYIYTNVVQSFELYFGV